MAVVTVQGVTINKMSLEQYKTLKNSNSLEENETYVITDIDEYIDCINCFREGKIIVSNGDIVFFNPNFYDFSNMAVDTLIMTEQSQSGLTFNYYLRYANNTYAFELESNGTALAVLYEGTSINNMELSFSEYAPHSADGYGLYSEITYINPNYKYLLDSIMKVNEAF